MKSGLLWYDADPQQGLPEKIARAAQRYREKLGRCPTQCYVHPAALASGETEVACRLEGGITLRVRLVGARQILPHHFWLGEEERPAATEAARGGDRPPDPSAETVDPPLPLQERPVRKAARRRREEGRLLQEAMAARSGARRQAAGRGRS